MRKDKTSAITINKREKSVRALELRKAGVSYEMIAQQLGYSNRTSAHRAVSRLLDATEKEVVTDLREMELRRLDDLFRSMYPVALKGNFQAVDRCLKIMERRSKITGLDAPEKTQSDIRQIIKVVYEDIQYVEDFNEEQSNSNVIDPQNFYALQMMQQQAKAAQNTEANEEEYEEGEYEEGEYEEGEYEEEEYEEEDKKTNTENKENK
jgi:hypothetical protein